MPNFLSEDSWKEKAVEQSRKEIVKRLQEEKKKQVDEILQNMAGREILTNK